jgi:hypothetical protein
VWHDGTPFGVHYGALHTLRQTNRFGFAWSPPERRPFSL